MAQVLIDVPDEFIDWAGWAQAHLKTELGATPVSDAETGPVNPAAEASQAPADDPWGAPAADASDTPAGAASDPWSAPATAGAPTPAASTAPPTGTYTTRPGTPPSTGSYTVDGKTHEFGIGGAPVCGHNQPAVKVTGRNDKGKQWKQFRCALSSTDRWKDKCEFSQWA